MYWFFLFAFRTQRFPGLYLIRKNELDYFVAVVDAGAIVASVVVAVVVVIAVALFAAVAVAVAADADADADVVVAEVANAVAV